MEPAEPVTALFELFGVSIETFIFVSGIVYLMVEWIKQKFPEIFVGGWKTEVLALLLSFGLALKICYPQWESIVALGVLCWIIPEGFHRARRAKANT